MDRVELGIKLEQMDELRKKGEFEEAARVADTIEWRKIKRWSELSFAADVYESAERFKDARNVCVYAYNRKLGGKRLVYRLAELSIKINDLDEAEELYNEFIEIAPKDTVRFILLYKINIARESTTDRLIEILEEYKQHELEEQFEYELALLYAKAGRIEECVRECDDLILWFNDGEYVEKALILKSNYVPLTQTQQNKFEEMQREKAMAAAMAAQPESEEDGMPRYEYEKKNASVSSDFHEVDANDIEIPVNNYSIYDTQNLQAELAKNMSIILEGMAKSRKTAEDEAVLKTTGFDNKDKPIIESLDKATPKTEQVLPEKKVSGSTKEIRINARYWNKNTPASEDVSSLNNENAESDSENQDDVIEGQIGIMDWLNSVPDNTAATIEPETVTENKTSEEERMVDELTRQLMEEVQADLRERTVTVAPEEHPEEEYIPSSETASSEDTNTSSDESLPNEVPASEETPDESLNTEADEVPVTLDKHDTADTDDNRLTDAEKKFVRKYFGIEGLQEAVTNTICGKKSEIRDGTSSFGNIAVTGKAETDREGFAINLFKALHAGESTKQLKIAKTTSASLNKKGIASSAEKIKGTTLIIENAGTMMPEVVKELTEFMLGQTGSMLVIITGEDFSINKLFREFPTFAALFGYKLELKNMSANDLVNMAKEYANERGYVIDEKALLQIYLIIDGLQMTYPGSEIEEVKKLVDEAIERCDNGTKWPFGRKSKGLIILKEKHFS